ncbi:hypothetical protein GCM10010341_80860 [Streptomyces noursei]|nr:hypothetical protein GCM10010341_80860 [Streptomyces noursei]
MAKIPTFSPVRMTRSLLTGRRWRVPPVARPINSPRNTQWGYPVKPPERLARGTGGGYTWSHAFNTPLGYDRGAGATAFDPRADTADDRPRPPAGAPYTPVP